ncbi:glycerol-3-phosphate acyltransferase [Leptothermofonsia sp. ETS-13]|uniref:glycerol-3-phosphate acyltransferase n=1 Tax=Leptothermofonsia sp. ETS-13 TaxID=3035696 RepID=UPI003B9FB571
MTLTQVWGAFLIFTICPLLGGVPLIRWITRALTGRELQRLGTRNISVSAAFYHGGRLTGILAVLSEALKGIVAVLLARYFFPQDPSWEIMALIALVMGRYWFGKGAGTTNVVWGYTAHDPIAAGLVFLIGGIGFTILRERRQARFGILVLFPLITALRHLQEPDLIVATIALAVLLGWIYMKIPDDLDLSPQEVRSGSQEVFRFFRGDRAVNSLDKPLDAHKVGQKAATLSYLRRLGYPVPMGWVLIPGDDPEPLLNLLDPSPKQPLVVRSSAVGEDSETTSAAGLYETVLGITRKEELMPAIARCLASFDAPAAVQYRRDFAARKPGDLHLPNASMAVLIQQQVRGIFSGVAFSRDPISRQGEAVVIEALPGSAAQIVSGQVTPESYQVFVPEATIRVHESGELPSWQLPDDITLATEGEGEVPPRLIQQVAFLARHLEAHYHGIPQDVEWSFDGKTLWLLQARPITTLLPIWTRKIASEVIPGLIHPLTWSINRPLTCGVWGKIFTIVLADRAQGLDFNETATLHYSRAYFNASLLGAIFRRMGLPPESLEFLTRGASFSKPPLQSTLRNLPGLLRLLSRELSLEKDFQRDQRDCFTPALTQLTQIPASTLSDSELLKRVDTILNLLEKATYYSILAPLSAALRKAIFKVSDGELDNRDTPEVAALRSLQELALAVQPLLQNQNQQAPSSPFNPHSSLLTQLAETSAGQAILAQFDRLLDRYGYLSEVGTDIAVPTWKEDPQPVRELFTQFCLNPTPPIPPPQGQRQKARRVQRRITLKGRVTEVYSRLLAELRWSFVALEKRWLETGLLTHEGDIFFLKFEEVRRVIVQGDPEPWADIIAQRKAQLEQDRQLEAVPFLVYGDDPPTPVTRGHWQATQQLQGIAASPGQAEGHVRVVRSLGTLPDIDKDTILVVPYTDSGWAPLLARAGGLIAEVGGRLSHGAIVAREYRIPAVMDVHDATHLLQDGQSVRIDGQQGIVEIL